MSNKLKTLSVACFSYVALMVVSCQPSNPIDYVLISGTITGTDGSYVTIKNDNYSYDIDMNSDGTFSDTLRLEGGYYRFYSERERTNVFLEEGFVLDLKIDQPQFDETLKFDGEGQGTNINNYLANKARLDEELTVDFQTLFSQDENEFTQSVMNWKTAMVELLSSADINKIEFRALESRNINYEYLSQIANYEYYHQYAAKDSDFRVSEGFKSHLSSIDLDNEVDFKTLDNYKNLLQSYFGSMIEQGQVQKAFDAIKNIKSVEIREGLVPGYTRKVQPGNDASEEIYQGILSITTDSTIIAKLTEKIEKIRKLQKGMPSATFAYQSIDGETVSLDNLKGKYVYVDVWATWCGPCLREIPALKKLEKDYHDSNVEFVSISIDAEKDFQKWQQMIADKDLKGLQLFADNSWQSDFVKAYAIDGIPRFIVIDPEGNILAPNAPRPSNPEIRELFQGVDIKS